MSIDFVVRVGDSPVAGFLLDLLAVIVRFLQKSVKISKKSVKKCKRMQKMF